MSVSVFIVLASLLADVWPASEPTARPATGAELVAVSRHAVVEQAAQDPIFDGIAAELRREYLNGLLDMFVEARALIDSATPKEARTRLRNRADAIFRARGAVMTALTKMPSVAHAMNQQAIEAHEELATMLEGQLGPLRAMPMVDAMLHHQRYAEEMEQFLTGRGRSLASDPVFLQSFIGSTIQIAVAAEIFLYAGLIVASSPANVDPTMGDWFLGQAYAGAVDLRVQAQRLCEAAIPREREVDVAPIVAEEDALPWLSELEG
jgi:hypothetical protein